MLPMDFDPYDYLTHLQQQQEKILAENKQLRKNQHQLAAAYNEQRDTIDKLNDKITALTKLLDNRKQHSELMDLRINDVDKKIDTLENVLWVRSER